MDNITDLWWDETMWELVSIDDSRSMWFKTENLRKNLENLRRKNKCKQKQNTKMKFKVMPEWPLT
jgi:hypothetical protein